MIHSLAGGKMRDMDIVDFAKVEIIESGEVRWYITNILGLKVGDIVKVPTLPNNLTNAKVLKIEKNVSAQCAPIPIKRAKEIFSKVE